MKAFVDSKVQWGVSLRAMVLMKNDTICAIATPAGRGGIGVLRLSGPSSLKVLCRVWSGKVAPELFSARKLYLGNIVVDGDALDFAMAVHMPGPNTYTGEDVVEISTHGSPAVLSKLLDACVVAGARLAEAGEFTRRAYLSGRIDLTQAEAVLDVIQASGEAGAKQAARQLSGELSSKINGIAEKIGSARAHLEAGIDFPEEDENFLGIQDVKMKIAQAALAARVLCDSYGSARLAREGFRVAIVGRPNVGKSSIFNELLGESRAIVHKTAGTTRDVVEGSISINGIEVKLSDTAGLRETRCEVEAMGTARSLSEVGASDAVIAVFDASTDLCEDDEKIIDLIGARPSIIVINKSDLISDSTTSTIKNKKWIRALSGVTPIVASAEKKTGIEEIKKGIAKFLGARAAGEGAVVASARHKAALDESILHMDEFLEMESRGEAAELLAQKLRMAHESILRITGESADEKLLDEIFSKFCIGK